MIDRLVVVRVGLAESVTVSVSQRGFCPTKLTVEAREGSIGGVIFPIGTLPLGTYDITVTLPDQTVSEARGPVTWIGSQASGALRVGTTFTETDRLATPGANITGQSSFGVITSTQTLPDRTNSARWIQFGMRFDF